MYLHARFGGENTLILAEGGTRRGLFAGVCLCPPRASFLALLSSKVCDSLLLFVGSAVSFAVHPEHLLLLPGTHSGLWYLNDAWQTGEPASSIVDRSRSRRLSCHKSLLVHAYLLPHIKPAFKVACWPASAGGELQINVPYWLFPRQWLVAR